MFLVSAIFVSLLSECRDGPSALKAPPTEIELRDAPRGGVDDDDNLLYRKPFSGGTTIDLGIWPTITRSDLDRYAWLAQLDEADHNVLLAAWSPYRDRALATRRQLVAPLWKASADYGRIGPQRLQDVQAALAWHETVRQRDRALDELLAVDNAYFDAVASMLSPTGAEALEAIGRQRSRDRTNVPRCYVPGSGEDPAALAWSIGKARSDFTDFDTQLARVAIEYLDATLEIARRRSAGRARVMGEATLLLARMHEAATDARADGQSNSALHEELRAARERLLEAPADDEATLSRINQQFVGRFAEVMPPEAGVVLRTVYRESAFKAVYPDPCDVEPTLRKAMSLLDVADDDPSRRLLQSITETYVDARERESSAMLRDHLETKRRFARKFAQQSGEQQAERDAVVAAQRRRCDAAGTTVDQMMELLARHWPPGDDRWATVRRTALRNVDMDMELWRRLNGVPKQPDADVANPRERAADR